MIDINNFNIVEPNYDCDICKDKGFVECSKEEADFEEEREEFDKSKDIWKSLGFLAIAIIKAIRKKDE